MEDADEPLVTSQIVSTIRLLQIMTAAVCSVNALMPALDGYDKCVPVQIMRDADSRNTFCSEAILWLSIRSTLRGQNIMFCKYLLCNLIKKC